MRILIVTHAPLSPEFGAGQMAINLGDALRRQGHEVTLWSPHPLPSVSRWFRNIQQLILMRKKLDQFLDTQEPFDIIDCFGILITKKVSQLSSVLVARSVQPDILYLVSNLLDFHESFWKRVVVFPFSCFSTLITVIFLLQGWIRSDFIFCLGTLEFQWMNKFFPWWKKKLFFYVNAISKTEQLEISKICASRVTKQNKGIKFLWIGRWAKHKGIDKLTQFIIDRSSSNQLDVFTIAGCGSNAEKYFPSKLLKNRTLKIIPSFTRNELYDLLVDHDIGLFTSRVEGWGLVLNEMLESGMLVFATEAGGVVDLRPFFTNLLPFPPPQLIKLSFKLCSQKLEEYYNFCQWDTISQRYLEILKIKLNSKYNMNITTNITIEKQ